MIKNYGKSMADTPQYEHGENHSFFLFFLFLEMGN